MRARRPSLPVLAVCLSLGAALLGASPGRAVERTAFTPTASGRPVPVDGSAPWCTVCKAQRPILSDLCADPAYEDLVVFDVDFDSQTPALRTLRVTADSTPIAYRGDREAGRSTGDTGIKALIDGTP